MNIPESTIDLQSLSPEEQRLALYNRQKTLLDTFLSHGAITQAQYDKSLTDLTNKMNVNIETEKGSFPPIIKESEI